MIFVGVITEDGKRFLPDEKRTWEAHKYSLAGYEVEVELRKRRSKRSYRQNRWLHSFLKDLATHLGYTVPELKLVGLVAVFGTHDVMGYTVPKEPHTSDLNTEQFSDLCEWFVQKAAECDFVVLYPEEFKRRKKRNLPKAC